MTPSNRVFDEIKSRFTDIWEINDASALEESNSLKLKKIILDFVSQMPVILLTLTSWQYQFDKEEVEETAERIADLDKIWMGVQCKLAEGRA